MLFNRTIGTYEKIMSNDETITYFEQHPMIEKIIVTPTFISLVTIPFIPTHKERNDKYFICPIGAFIITLNLKSFSVNIENVLGPVNLGRGYFFHHYHVCEEWSPMICWGNTERLIDSARYQKDCYGLLRLALELVMSGDPEPGDIDGTRYIAVMIGLQLKYAIYKKDETIKRFLLQQIKYFGVGDTIHVIT